MSWIRGKMLPIAVLGVLAALFQCWGSIVFPNQLKLWFIDVGQGDGLVVETPKGKKVVIDGGPGDSILTSLSMLTKYSEEIDFAITTHAHADHYEGIVETSKYYQVNQFGLTELDDVTNKYLRTQRDDLQMVFLDGDDVWTVDGVTFQVLWPDAGWIEEGGAKSNPNNDSIVVRIEYKGFCALVTGDIEKEVEKILVSEMAEDLRCEVLKVPHHGAATSSTEEFIEAVDPLVAVVSVGEENRYGHPASEVIERYERRKITLFRTDRDGVVLIRTDGESIYYTDVF